MERNETTNTRARTVRRYIIPGCLNVSNFCWATITSFGGAGFILGGLSSFVQRNLLPFTFDFRNIVFFPQGLVMVFYGSVGLLLDSTLGLRFTGASVRGSTKLTPTGTRFVFFDGGSRVKTGASILATLLRTSKPFGSISKTVWPQNVLFIWL